MMIGIGTTLAILLLRMRVVMMVMRVMVILMIIVRTMMVMMRLLSVVDFVRELCGMWGIIRGYFWEESMI